MSRFTRNALAFTVGLVLGGCVPYAYAQQGLRAPAYPALDGMGGGTGLIPVSQYHLPNNAGGAIVVDDEAACVVDGKTVEGLHRAFTFSSAGEQVEGCWGRTGEDEITIVWFAPDGRRFKASYSISDFKRVKLTQGEVQ